MRGGINNLISKYSTILLCFLVFIGVVLRFYNLNWGAPFYFHPDERNVASSISQLSTESLNPNFFAYGSFPIYAIFFTGLIINFITSCHFSLENCQVSFEEAIIISRIFSASLGTLVIPIVYLLGKTLNGKITGLLAAFLTTFSVGLIQFSHFGTFEMWTTTFAALQLYAATMYLKTLSKKHFYFMVIFTGLLTAIKISNIVLIMVPIVCLLVNLFSDNKYRKVKEILKTLLLFFLLIVYSLAIFLVANPFTFLDEKSFIGSMRYESAVALGTMSVFYTGEFFGSMPILFQINKVFPFLLSPLIVPMAFISFPYVIYLGFSRRRSDFLLLLIIFAVLFLSQAFLFVKWTRYMLPTLPFIYLMIGITLKDIYFKTKGRLLRPIFTLFILLLMLSSIIFSLSYVKTVFASEDTRTLAKEFALHNIPSESVILSEVYDLGITPFNDHFKKITLFNFYDLDNVPNAAESLDEILKDTEYLILPSQRIFATRTGNPEKFPLGEEFYTGLLKNSEKYTLLYESPCDIFCKIIYLGDPVKRFEGTANVFDRPNVMIFKLNEK